MKYYIGNTFVDPTACCFRYTKIIKNIEKIAYHIWEAGYLADSANIQQKNKKMHWRNETNHPSNYRNIHKSKHKYSDNDISNIVVPTYIYIYIFSLSMAY